MSILDTIVAAVTPTPSDEDAKAARAKARNVAGGSGWLWDVLNHHVAIEDGFAAVKGAASATERRAAQKRLGLILTAHSIAEEAVIYPAMALGDQKGHATEMYAEQSAAKVQMAALDDLDPMSQDYLDKLAHLEGAIAHHVHEEEGDYFPRLRDNGDPAMQAKLTRRYREEYERYLGVDA